jgi:hypothetical protein
LASSSYAVGGLVVVGMLIALYQMFQPHPTKVNSKAAKRPAGNIKRENNGQNSHPASTNDQITVPTSSWYFLIAGLFITISAISIFRKKALGVWIFAAVFVD